MRNKRYYYIRATISFIIGAFSAIVMPIVVIISKTNVLRNSLIFVGLGLAIVFVGFLQLSGYKQQQKYYEENQRQLKEFEEKIKALENSKK